MNEKAREAQFFATSAADYATAAEVLMQHQKTSDSSMRTDNPIHLLVSHGFELSLKAYLVRFRYGDPKEYGHKLLDLYSELTSNFPSIANLPDHIDERWRAKLHQLQKQRSLDFPEYWQIIDKQNNETPKQIDALSFGFESDVEMYDFFVNKNGNLFRYPQENWRSVKIVRFGDESIERAPQSMIWATRIVIALVQEE